MMTDSDWDSLPAAARSDILILEEINRELIAALQNTTRMLAFEATCHEESGNEKRCSYVKPIRDQVAAAFAVIVKATKTSRPAT